MEHAFKDLGQLIVSAVGPAPAITARLQAHPADALPTHPHRLMLAVCYPGMWMSLFAA